MTAPNPRKQKRSRAIIDKIFDDSANVWVIHYSCESFYDRDEGRSPRITSIAMRKLDSAQTVSFSIHQVAEREGFSFGEISDNYDRLEKKMLDEFYSFIDKRRGMKYLHWNMRDINYGFPAIEHRYRVLGGDPVTIDDQYKYDLAPLLIDIYGVGYIGHPRLESLMEKNNIKPKDFLNGKQEADAFENGNYVSLHQSTLRKVDVIANLANRTHDRNLNVNTSWWEMHGGRLRTFVEFLVEHKYFSLAAGLASIIALVAGIFGFLG